MKILKGRLLMKMSETRQKGYRQAELFDTHAPFQSPLARYAPFLVANFSPSSLICALPTYTSRHGFFSSIARRKCTLLRFTSSSRFRHSRRRITCMRVIGILWRVVISYRSLIIRGRRAFSSPR